MSAATQAAQAGVARFGELLAEYARMKGVEGDVFSLGAHELYTGVLTDAIHWATSRDVDLMMALSEAIRISATERE